jgi:hypothetical protein
MIRLLVFATVLLVGGCATSREVYFADGSKGHRISCNYGSCLAKAGDICEARGYFLVNLYGEAMPFAMASGGYYLDVAQSGPLFVKCK